MQATTFDLPEIVPQKKVNHSASAVGQFLICERRYASQKARPFQPTVHTVRGTVVHLGIEGLLAGKSLDEVLEGLPKELDGFDVDLDEIRSYLEHMKPALDLVEPVKSEYWIRERLPGCERPFVGKVDLLSACCPDGSDRKCIIDWKSVRSMEKSLTEFEAKKSIQARAYTLLEGINDFAYMYFTPYHDVRVTHVHFSEEEMRHSEAFLARTCRAIENRWETQDFRTVLPGGLCSKAHCEEWHNCYG